MDGIAASRKPERGGPDGPVRNGAAGRRSRRPCRLSTWPNIPEYTPQQLMTMEKEVTGLYLTGHPMDAYREAARRRGAVTIGSILSDFAREDGPAVYRDGQMVNGGWRDLHI